MFQCTLQVAFLCGGIAGPLFAILAPAPFVWLKPDGTLPFCIYMAVCVSLRDLHEAVLASRRKAFRYPGRHSCAIFGQWLSGLPQQGPYCCLSATGSQHRRKHHRAPHHVTRPLTPSVSFAWVSSEGLALHPLTIVVALLRAPEIGTGQQMGQGSFGELRFWSSIWGIAGLELGRFWGGPLGAAVPA